MGRQETCVNHGLIQAYSRTNRILNSVKTYGNIVTFRDLEEETNDAIALFGNKDAKRHRAAQAVRRLLRRVRREGRRAARAVPARRSRSSARPRRRRSSPCSAQILRLQNILTSFDEFAGNEILTERQSQDYRSIYLDLYAEFRQDQNAEKESINDDVVFEIELIKQVEINVDYILMLVQKYRDATRRRRGQGDPRRRSAARDRLQPDAAQQEGPHRGLRRLASRPPATSTTSGVPTSQRAARPS